MTIDISDSAQNTTENYRSKNTDRNYRSKVEQSSNDLNIELLELPSTSPVSRIITLLDNYNSTKVCD